MLASQPVQRPLRDLAIGHVERRPHRPHDGAAVAERLHAPGQRPAVEVRLERRRLPAESPAVCRRRGMVLAGGAEHVADHAGGVLAGAHPFEVAGRRVPAFHRTVVILGIDRGRRGAREQGERDR